MRSKRNMKKMPSDGSLDESPTAGYENKRGNWASQAEFLLSCIGYAVGLGNIWRFPYLCMRNGGGAFIIPYFVCLLVVGIPLFFLEMVIGQYSSLSPLTVWQICPLFRGLGWGAVFISLICCLYYNTIITWVLYYLGSSLTSELPWASCAREWNTYTCYRHGIQANDTRIHGNLTSENSTLGNLTEANLYGDVTAGEQLLMSNFTHVKYNSSQESMTAGEEFWQYNVLQRSDGIEDIGGMRWELFACLCVAWILIFFCLIKGIKTSGKVVYVTATAPYLFLLILLVRGATLPGSLNGIKYYIVPNWEQLLEFKTWVEACLQIFYSLGPGWGGIITMASYNKFNNNCLRDSIIIPMVNCGTSFFAGFVIFSIIGFMAYEAQVEVTDVITSGPGLAFVAYPSALSRLPISPVWAVFFFAMLLTVGLDSQFCMLETVLTGFCDEFPRLMPHKIWITIGSCIVGLGFGTIFVTKAGIYYFQVVDWYLAVISLPTISFLECVVVTYIYGVNRLYGDIKLMIGYRPSFVWKILWCAVTPAWVLVIMGFTLYNFAPPTYGDYGYPGWAIGLGWSLNVVVLLALPILAAYSIYEQEGSFWQRLKAALRPSSMWCPAAERTRRESVKGRDLIYVPKVDNRYKMVPLNRV